MALLKQTASDLEWPDWFGRRLLDWPALRELAEAEGTTMRAEEYEDDGALGVCVEMPGLDPDEDVDITVSDHLLRIKAERRQETKTKDKRGYRSELRYGSLLRSVPLPSGAKEEDVTASCTDEIAKTTEGWP
jgi:HSP20 family molecular chaperone IbpA